jgi:hypothetical protein
VTAPNGVVVGIAGVQSTCVASGYLSWMYPWLPQTWMWATGVSSCTSAALYRSRSTILNVIATRTIASNDFNDDNLPDIVWHNEETGETQIWFMDGHQIRSRATVVDEGGSPIFVGSPWSVVGANDMDGNGYADIVWHNEWSGETQLWLMTGGRISWRATVHGENGAPIMVGWPWTIVATDDMNQDRRPDIVWHNDVSGETQIWYMNNWRLTGRQTVRWESYYAGPALVGWPWRITSTNDFDNDRIGDIVWHNESTGETQIWFMNVGAIRRRATVDAWNDGGDAFVLEPWRIVRH